ncbi:hypothetical protein CEXT_327751 [Caerostris extrusa]|uniref:Uncharacterized protein n=1 Tax=Caerostris extrusa TaxID=172846 RepID=A0AAV4MGY5_CAEEX|nr:hypothetical protein CEXT_327751 [Caerostris extrusa]
MKHSPLKSILPKHPKPRHKNPNCSVCHPNNRVARTCSIHIELMSLLCMVSRRQASGCTEIRRPPLVTRAAPLHYARRPNGRFAMSECLQRKRHVCRMMRRLETEMRPIKGRLLNALAIC